MSDMYPELVGRPVIVITVAATSYADYAFKHRCALLIGPLAEESGTKGASEYGGDAVDYT
ncbi:MAG: hypothetical protein AUJ51_00425 [Elusimicrobia bacterium CG1_02_56_21]|nr:MAG: hypothetical protein AUJ51_00425 [Elusimicrobia bacterium CG1_02_56_21]